MQLVTLSPRSSDDEGATFERLLASLSSQLAAVPVDGLSQVLPAALAEVCRTLRVEHCSVVEYDEDGRCRGYHSSPPLAASTLDSDVQPGSWAWLAGRMMALHPVAISRLDDLPLEAHDEREYGRASGVAAMLALPVAIGVHQICALILGSTRARDWQGPIQHRARLLAEIVGSALQRSRQEAALRASLAEIQRLNSRLTADNVCLKEDIQTFHDFDDIVGESAIMRGALERLSQVAPLNCSVLFLGETGTGKELFARALHERSRRRSRALVRVNCAALPPSLIESELFGHEKGAFTGAINLRQGRFELADGGTLFLDEIGDLPLDMQGKLLRVLQEGEFERVGSSRTRKVDVRVIAATHHDLSAGIAEGTFRADLYYRLSVFPIHVPALRERREDIPSLTWFFVHHHQREMGRRITKIPNHVMTALTQHDWPGNVRELENTVERALIRSSGDTLQLDLPLADQARAGRPALMQGTLDDVQRAHIEQVLRQCRGRINGRANAAERLGLHPNTLRFRMKKLGIVPQRGLGASGLAAGADGRAPALGSPVRGDAISAEK